MWGEGSGRCDDLHVSSVYVPDIRQPGGDLIATKSFNPEGEPQISPLRYAPVEMTILLRCRNSVFSVRLETLSPIA
jgi:hypothetical protein